MYYEKYRKYKNKYLALKNIIGGSDPDFERAIKASLADLNEGDVEVGRKLYVIPNSGMIEGMSQQCFWISILNYLQINPIANIAEVENVGQLRTLVGLGKDTEHLPFDEDDIRFRNALESLTAIFDLQIVVHFINAHGNQIILRDQYTGIPRESIRPINDAGRNIVHITQHGLYHFQYMVEDGVGAGANGVLLGNKFYKDKKMEDVTDKTTMFKVYEEEIKKLNELKIKMNNEFTIQGVSPSLIPSYYDSFDDEITRINKEIKRYEGLIQSSNKKLEESKDDLDPEVLKYIEEHFKAMEQMKNK
jgi:hypothetical protein